jgi:hypothetical protein
VAALLPHPAEAPPRLLQKLHAAKAAVLFAELELSGSTIVVARGNFDFWELDLW